MKLIPLDDVNNLVRKYAFSVVMDLGFRNEIKKIKSIDPVKIIDEMLKELSFSKADGPKIARATLEELKSRLSPNHSSHV